MAKTKSNGMEMLFTVRAPDASTVSLVGSFNDWDPASCPMTRDSEGVWYVSVPLGAGRYEYKFVVDGQWCCDPGADRTYGDCPHCVQNDYGTMNQVVHVPSAA